jgi:hypothetical protein
MVLIIEETLVVTEASIEATGAVGEAEVGGMTVETGVAKLRENTETEEMIGARPRPFAMIEEAEIDGDEKSTEGGDHRHLRDEDVHPTIPHAMFEIHRQAST